MKKIALLGLAMASLLMATSCATQQPVAQAYTPPPLPTYTGPKQAVPVLTGILTMHPDSICYRGRDNTKYWLFADQANACLFVTQNENLYPLFSDHLPVALQSTVPAVVLGGVKIDPLVIFSEEQVADISRKVLIGLNHFDVVKITAYGTVKNLSEARGALAIILNKNIVPNTQVPTQPQQPALQRYQYQQQQQQQQQPAVKPAPLSNGYDPTKQL
jgi:hypothetical protein